MSQKNHNSSQKKNIPRSACWPRCSVILHMQSRHNKKNRQARQKSRRKSEFKITSVGSCLCMSSIARHLAIQNVNENQVGFCSVHLTTSIWCCRWGGERGAGVVSRSHCLWGHWVHCIMEGKTLENGNRMSWFYESSFIDFDLTVVVLSFIGYYECSL